MSEVRPRRMTVDEFLPWQESQDARYELIDGEPVQMTGGNRRHDRVIRNILVKISAALENHPCEPFTADVAIVTPRGNALHADVGVDCGPYDPESRAAAEPTVAFEVLSPSNRAAEMARKLSDYRSIATMRHVFVVDPERLHILAWSRDASGQWAPEQVTDISQSLRMSRLNIALPVASIYAQIGLP